MAGEATETTIRDDLEATVTELSETETPVVEKTVPVEQIEHGEPPPVDKVVEESSKVKEGAPKTKEEPLKTRPLAPVKGVPAKPSGLGVPAKVGTPAALKAPQSWKPEERIAWDKLPAGPETDALKRAALRREQEITTGLQEAAPAKRFVRDFASAIRPYEANLRTLGVDPLQATANLFQVDHMLRSAPMQMRAKIIAGIIQSYGLDVKAVDDALAEALQGKQAGAPGAPQEFRDPRVDGLMQQLEDARKQNDEARQVRSRNGIEEFKKTHEFVDDLREDMADFMEVALRRNEARGSRGEAPIAIDLEEIYNLALLMPQNASMREIVEQRRALEATEEDPATQGDLDAAASLRGSPAGVRGGEIEPEDLRGTIEQTVRQLSKK